GTGVGGDQRRGREQAGQQETEALHRLLPSGNRRMRRQFTGRSFTVLPLGDPRFGRRQLQAAR
ncbi:MAG: hypothetical protein ABW200_11140, partial [Hyphomicrobiaceae bacterium]